MIHTASKLTSPTTTTSRKVPHNPNWFTQLIHRNFSPNREAARY
jgi:hypothetical protein